MKAYPPVEEFIKVLMSTIFRKSFFYDQEIIDKSRGREKYSHKGWNKGGYQGQDKEGHIDAYNDPETERIQPGPVGSVKVRVFLS
jgi:hypothetical protein